jgi:hypothetical protein
LTCIEELTQDLGVGARAVDVQLSPDTKRLLVAITFAGLCGCEVGNNSMLTGGSMITDMELLGLVALSPPRTCVCVGNAFSLIDEMNESSSFINSVAGPTQGAQKQPCAGL